jgi:hypothetical protein
MSFSNFIASLRAHYQSRPDEQSGVQIMNRVKELLESTNHPAVFQETPELKVIKTLQRSGIAPK